MATCTQERSTQTWSKQTTASVFTKAFLSSQLTNGPNKLDCLSLANHFQPSQMFAIRSKPTQVKARPSRVGSWPCWQKLKWGKRACQVKNTLAYLARKFSKLRRKKVFLYTVPDELFVDYFWFFTVGTASLPLLLA